MVLNIFNIDPSPGYFLKFILINSSLFSSNFPYFEIKFKSHFKTPKNLPQQVTIPLYNPPHWRLYSTLTFFALHLHKCCRMNNITYVITCVRSTIIFFDMDAIKLVLYAILTYVLKLCSSRSCNFKLTFFNGWNEK